MSPERPRRRRAALREHVSRQQNPLAFSVHPRFANAAPGSHAEHRRLRGHRTRPLRLGAASAQTQSVCPASCDLQPAMKSRGGLPVLRLKTGGELGGKVSAKEKKKPRKSRGAASCSCSSSSRHSILQRMGKVTYGPVASEVHGKVGLTVFARNRSGAYARQWVKPANPNTTRQQTVRANLKAIAAAWSKTLTDTQRAGWTALGQSSLYATRFGLDAPKTGRQLFLSLNLTTQNLSAAMLTDPPELQSPDPASNLLIANLTNAPNTVKLSWDGATGAHTYTVVYATKNLNAGVQFFIDNLRQIAVIPPSPTQPVDVTTAYLLKFGSILAGQKIGFAIKTANALDGVLSPRLQNAAIAGGNPPLSNYQSLTLSGITATLTVNQIRVVLFNIGATGLTFSKIGIIIDTADAVGLYDWGIYDSSGNLVAHTGAATMPATGFVSRSVIGGPFTLPSGTYFLSVTGNATAGAFGLADSNGCATPLSSSASVTTSTAGVLPASITVPALTGSKSPWATLSFCLF